MNSIVHSARREARRLRRSPWDLAMITWVPLLAVALLWWIFSAGVPHGLPIGVQDEDHSTLSRQLTRMLDATPGLHVARPISGRLETQAALRSTDIKRAQAAVKRPSSGVICGSAVPASAFAPQAQATLAPSVQSLAGRNSPP